MSNPETSGHLGRRRLLAALPVVTVGALSACTTAMPSSYQPSLRSTFLLVHGAWHGGWCWQRVAALLRESGHNVYTPTLTGLADRSHLMQASIGLDTHVDDVVNLVRWEDLNDVVLCGHSYGGMVIAGAAQALGSRVRSIVFLDAFLPEPGRSLLDLAPAATRERTSQALVGHLVASPSAKVFLVNEGDQAWVDAKLTPHPYKTFTDSLARVDAVERIVRKHYVFATKYNSSTYRANFERLRSAPGWTVTEMAHGHDLMVDAPREVADLLLRAAR